MCGNYLEGREVVGEGTAADLVVGSLLAHRGPQLVEPTAEIEVAGGCESRACELLGVEVTGALLRGVLVGREGSWDRFGGKGVTEA